MNRCFREPLVEAHPGGGRQAGARVTEAGKEAREAYRALAQMAGESAHGVALNALTRALRETPPAQ